MKLYELCHQLKLTINIAPERWQRKTILWFGEVYFQGRTREGTDYESLGFLRDMQKKSNIFDDQIVHYMNLLEF